ncbi:MAG: SHOCT domain-containing protein [Halobacteriota archaeon]
MSTNTTNRTLITLGLVILALVVLGPLLLVGGMGTMGGYWMGGTGMPMMGGSAGSGSAFPLWMAVFGLLSQVLFFLLLFGGGYVLYRSLRSDESESETDPALEALRVAYARGDLTDEEFERRRERLESADA